MLYAVPTPAAEVVADLAGILGVAIVVTLVLLRRPRRNVSAEPAPICIMPRHAPDAPNRLTKVGRGTILVLPPNTVPRRRR